MNAQKPQSVLWINKDDSSDRAVEDYPTAREAYERIVTLHEQRPDLLFAVGDMDSSSWIEPEDAAQRLASINTRRDAVALELLCQSQSIYRDDEQTEPDLAMARRVMDATPMLAKGMYRRADRLIAAYEQAVALAAPVDR